MWETETVPIQAKTVNDIHVAIQWAKRMCFHS